MITQAEYATAGPVPAERRLATTVALAIPFSVLLTARRPASCNNGVQDLEDTAMLGDGGLAFAEFVMQEPLPLATVHRAILEFLRDAEDVVLFGAQAVNA